MCREAQVHRSVLSLQATKKVQENLECVAPASPTTNALRISLPACDAAIGQHPSSNGSAQSQRPGGESVESVPGQ